MPFLLDTNICSEHLRGKNPRVYGKLVQHGGQIYVSRLVCAELYALAFRRNEKEVDRLEDFLPELKIIEFDSQCARKYGQIHAHLAERGVAIGTVDLMLAATAVIHNLILVTHDRGFKRVADVLPGLRLVDWLD